MKKRSVMFLVPILVVSGLLFVILIFTYINAKETGNNVGNITGRTVGTALGSFDGFTKGLEEGYEDGKRQGLSAEDTNVIVANEMASIGKLDVLVAFDQFVDNFSEGNDYKALFVYKAKAVFSINLSLAHVFVNGNDLEIVIPQPECEVTIDEEQSEEIAEWQKYFWSGNSEAGYIGYMNSMKKIKDKAASEMSNYNILMSQAKASAKRQVEMLANSIKVNSSAGDRYNVKVVFEGEEQEDE